MLKLVILIFLSLSQLSALDIDTVTLEKIIAINPNAKAERIILAKYYLQKNEQKKALTLTEEVLKINPKDKDALKIRQRIKQIERNNVVLNEASLTRPIKQTDAQKRLQNYYSTNNYQLFNDLYQALISEKIPLDDTYHIKAAYIYLWGGRYKESKLATQRVQQTNNIDVAKINADICYYQENYRCAARLYEKLYNTSYDITYAIKLINSYIYLGETQKAQRLYNYLIRKNKNNKALQKLGKKLTTAANKYLLSTKEAYEENPNYKTLNAYIIALYEKGRTEQALNLLHTYNEHNSSKKSLLLEAKYLMWDGENEQALEILQNKNISNELEAKLMLGQLYSWNQEFDKAKQNLENVISNTQEGQQLYNAKKALAFVYMWEKNDEKAKKLFQRLLKENKNDKEIQEALMELAHNYKGLISIYEKRSAGGQNTKRLAELYSLTNSPKKAIKMYKKYLTLNPQDLEATKELALLLINNKEYYQGFGYLEYYNAKKRSESSTLLLAKNYYWHGFSKEALNVLNQYADENPENPENQNILNLKAKILKISPRFTIQNKGTTITSYFQDLGKKQLFLADTLYFNTHYKASLKYYNDYLQSHPNDTKARYRYAFALENAKKYGKAEGEFSLLLWNYNNQETHYHYAYNLMKNEKLDQAEDEFKKLKKMAYHTLTPMLKDFLQGWRRAWELQDYKQYTYYYSYNITSNQRWAFKKQYSFKNSKFISVSIYDPVYKEAAKDQYIINFYQEYATDKRSDEGYKTLYVDCNQTTKECVITKETWQAGKYQKRLELLPNIEKSLKDIEYYKKHPQTFNSHKKKISTLSKKKSINQYHNIVLKPKPVIKIASTEKKNFIKEPTVIKKKKKTQNNLNDLKGKLYYFSDSIGITFKSADLFYIREKITDKISLGVDGGVFSIEEKNVNKYNGIRYGASLYYDHFQIRLGKNDFDDFSQFVPSIFYRNSYKEHGYTLEYTHQNALFYTYTLCPYEERIDAHHFSASDYVMFDNKTDLWSNIVVNLFDNSDIGIIGQFDWRFYHNNFLKTKATYHIALEGWYTTHTSQNSCFYSPSFADATLLRVDPKYIFNRYIGIRGKIGAGYSFSDQQIPYKYGLWIFGNPINKLSYNAGCLHSTTARGNYSYDECKLLMEYKW